MSEAPDLFALASIREDERSARSARRVLDGPDRDQAVDHLFARALSHHVWPTVVAHLERAGGDLDRLTVSADLFRRSWPLNALLPRPTHAGDGRIPLSSIRRLTQSHGDRLRAVAADLAGVRDGRVVALFGVAYDAAHPGYRHRAHNDADLFAADAEAGSAAIDRLMDGLGFALVRFRTGRGPEGPVAHGKFIRRTEDGYQLHVDLIVGGRPAGPGLRPPFIPRPLFARAGRVAVAGGSLSVPSLEDMVLLQAEKATRRGSFVLRDFNDVQFLLTEAPGGIDWDYLATAARSHGVHAALHAMAVETERREGPAVAGEVLEALAPAVGEREVVAALARRAIGEDASGSLEGASSKWRRSWFMGQVRRQARDPRGLGRLALDLAGGRVLKAELGLARLGVGRRLRRLGLGADRPLALGAVPDPRSPSGHPDR